MQIFPLLLIGLDRNQLDKAENIWGAFLKIDLFHDANYKKLMVIEMMSCKCLCHKKGKDQASLSINLNQRNKF